MLISGVSQVSTPPNPIDVQKNRIERNNYVGVAMIDWCVGQGDPTCQSVYLPAGFEDPTVNYVQIVGNQFAANGTDKPPLPGPFPVADILYVGADFFSPYLPAGQGNCQSDNKLVKTPTPKNPGLNVVVLSATGILPACNGNNGNGNNGNGNSGNGNNGNGNSGNGNNGNGNSGNGNNGNGNSGNGNNGNGNSGNGSKG